MGESGEKKVKRLLGPQPTKLGREELEELIDLWELSPAGRRKISAALAREKFGA